MATGVRITGISSMATRLLLADLAQSFRVERGVDVAIESVGGVDAARRMQAGEPFDCVVLAADAMARLDAAGKLLPGSCVGIVRSGVAVAVAAGAPLPDIATESALRDTVLAAPSIGYSTGPSGTALLQLFERWGLADTLRPRCVQAPPGVAVGALVARGEVALGFQQLSELLHVEGIRIVGAMPPGAEVVTVFSAAVAAASTQPDAARAFVDHLRSPDSADAKRRHGMEPA